MLGLALYWIFIVSTFTRSGLCSGITSFTDKSCRKSHEALHVENGYPDGLCTPLNITGNLEAFQIVQLDPNCAVTLYGHDDESGQPCSSSLKIVGDLATCYNSSWDYFSIDGCDKPRSSSAVVLPSTTSSTRSVSLSTSSPSPSPTTSASTAASPSPAPTTHVHNTPAIIGAIIGTVAFCAILIALLVFCLHRRNARAPKPPPYPPSYELSPERTLTEISRGSTAPVSPAKLGGTRKEMWGCEAAVEIGHHSYAPPVELPGVSYLDIGEKKRESALIRVHLAR